MYFTLSWECKCLVFAFVYYGPAGVGAGVGIGVSVSGGVSVVGADGDSHSVTCGLEGFRVCFCVQVGEK